MFSKPTSPLILKQMKRELKEASRGIELDLLVGKDSTHASAPAQACRSIIVQLWGHCEPTARRSRYDGDALAWVDMSQGQLTSRVEVDCERIRTFLGHELAHDAPHVAETRFGRALGRIVAHELWHLLLNRSDHQSRGLARERLSAADLLRRRITFQD